VSSRNFGRWIPGSGGDHHGREYKLIKHVATLRADGASIRGIAAALKRSPTTIHKLIRAAA
jgi:hypothetical protein